MPEAYLELSASDQKDILQIELNEFLTVTFYFSSTVSSTYENI